MFRYIKFIVIALISSSTYSLPTRYVSEEKPSNDFIIFDIIFKELLENNSDNGEKEIFDKDLNNSVIEIDITEITLTKIIHLLGEIIDETETSSVNNLVESKYEILDENNLDYTEMPNITTDIQNVDETFKDDAPLQLSTVNIIDSIEDNKPLNYSDMLFNEIYDNLQKIVDKPSENEIDKVI